MSHDRALHYTAFVVLEVYPGQQSTATISKLTSRQFRDALWSEKPILHVNLPKTRLNRALQPAASTSTYALQPSLNGRKLFPGTRELKRTG